MALFWVNEPDIGHMLQDHTRRTHAVISPTAGNRFAVAIWPKGGVHKRRLPDCDSLEQAKSLAEHEARVMLASA